MILGEGVAVCCLLLSGLSAHRAVMFAIAQLFLFTVRMLFLPPNQQCQSTEGLLQCHFMMDKSVTVNISTVHVHMQ